MTRGYYLNVESHFLIYKTEGNVERDILETEDRTCLLCSGKWHEGEEGSRISLKLHLCKPLNAPTSKE